jgi:hypothetical protein
VLTFYRATAALREAVGEKLLQMMGIKIMVPKKGKYIAAPNTSKTLAKPLTLRATQNRPRKIPVALGGF